MIKIKLCKGCINDLKDYNPYIDDKGRTIPLDELDIIEVNLKDCDNYKIGDR
jgi:hypothetical protein